jgi:hypothetical protein
MPHRRPWLHSGVASVPGRQEHKWAKADIDRSLSPITIARVTRDGFWTRCYVRNLSPEKAAELAAREYDSTHPPEWIKRQR